MINRFRLVYVIHCCLFFVVSAEAGNLRDFESDAGNPAQNATRPAQNMGSCTDCNQRRTDDASDDLFWTLMGYAAEGLFELTAQGGANSNLRIQENHTDEVIPRKLGESLIPFFRMNLNIQGIEDRSYGLDGKLELGRGSLALEFRDTRYRDNTENEQLRLRQLQVLYRMSFGNRVGVNLGLGSAKLDGAEHSKGTMVSIPLFLHNRRHITWEIRQTWMFADEFSVDELDLSAIYAIRRTAIRLGYRRLDSLNSSLEGPYLGVDYLF